MDQQQHPGVPGPAGRRLHIAHRRSPSEMTPLLSKYPQLLAVLVIPSRFHVPDCTKDTMLTLCLSQWNNLLCSNK